MAKTKTCSFCGKDVPRLWYSKPPTCASYQCKQKYNESKKSGSAPVKKRSSIKPVSDKQSKRLQEYRKVRDEYLKENNRCEICGINRDLTLHHKKTRQYHLCDVEVFMTLCISCHERVHREDKWARDRGYLINSR